MKTAEKNTEIEILFSKTDLSIEEILGLKEKILKSIVLRRKLEKSSAEFSEDKRGKLTADSARTRKGIAFWILNKTDEAIGLLESARANQLTNYFLSLCYLERGKANSALEILDKLYREEPDKIYFVTALSEALLKNNKPDEAMSVLERARKTSRSEPDLYYYTGRCLEYLGDYKKAEAEYQHALRLKPQHPRTLFRMAYRSDLSGDDETSFSLYQQLCRQVPSYTNAWINLGLLYEDKNEYDQAIHCYQTVLSYEPNHPRAKLYLKDALASKNMFYDELLSRRERQLKNIINIPITDFPLSIRSRHILGKLNIKTLGELASRSEEELLKHENFGMTSLNELKEILARKGLTFAPVGYSPARPGGLPILPIIEEPHKKQDVLNKSVFDIDWSTRIRTCFNKLKIYTLRDLIGKTEEELLNAKSLGQISLKEIKQRLAELGLALKQPTVP